MKRDARRSMAAFFGAMIRAVALCAAFHGCAAGSTRADTSSDPRNVPAATESEVLAALEMRGRIRAAFLLEHPSVSMSPTDGYKIRVPSDEKNVSLALSGILLDELDAIWNGHDPRTHSAWIFVDGVVERIVIRPTHDGGFDDFSPELYQRLPSRDPWGILVDTRLLGWEYRPRHVLREREHGVGKGF
jgi:hypothetical protein